MKNTNALTTYGLRRLVRWLMFILMMLAMFGCGLSANADSLPSTTAMIVNVTPTSTRQPTLTPTATTTATSTPTVTPSPTRTSTPAPMPTVAKLQSEIGQHPYTTVLQVTDDYGNASWVSVHYLLYLPQAYRSGTRQKWPLLLFLHGSNERGDNVLQVAETGLPQMLAGRSDFPFIVVSPQVPTDQWWEDQLNALPVLLDQIEANYAVDVKREYLTGMSMGGFGAWAVAMRYPQRFAAMAPIAGGWDGSDMPPNICQLKDLPIWVFHGAQDVNVFPQQTEQMVDALQQCGGNVRFTLYPDADHDGSWQRAYTDPELYQWLLAQHLP